MFNRIDLANFCQTFAILLSSGVPVLEALESSQAMVRSETYNNAIKKISLKVTQGKSLSESFREDKDVFPPFLLHIISVGEKSGSLDTMLKKASDIYTEKVNSNIKTMTALIEPIFLVLIAIGASGLVFSIIMPMYSILGNFSGKWRDNQTASWFYFNWNCFSNRFDGVIN